MAQVRKRIAPPLVGSDIILVIRPGQNINQVLDCTYQELVNSLSTAFTSASGFVPETRTLTINGETYDLTQDRSWTVGGGGGAVDSVNGQTGIVILALDDLSDVNAPSPFVNQFLKWDGSAWVSAFVNGTNGLQNDFATYDIKLGGALTEATSITAGSSSPSHKLNFLAPTNTSTAGSFTFQAISGGYSSPNNVLAVFDSNDIITAEFITGTYGVFPGIAVKIRSKNALCTPIVIYGNSALGSGEIFKVTDAGQLIMEEYNTSTSFQSVSGSSVGVLNVDGTGKVFVGAGGGGGGGDSVSPFLLMGG